MQTVRISRDLERLRANSPWGVSCDPIVEGNYDKLEATILGPKSSPYEGGIFRIEIEIPKRYPFEPPLVKFLTSIYHPNVDKAGRICMDMLKMPPTGSWVPTITMELLLVSLQTLMSSPNPEDPLMVDIANEFKNNHSQFIANAKEHTQLNAK